MRSILLRKQCLSCERCVIMLLARLIRLSMLVVTNMHIYFYIGSPVTHRILLITHYSEALTVAASASTMAGVGDL
jgi:hypothetical protein